MEAMGDRIPPPFSESLRGHLRTRRHLTALVFTRVDAPGDLTRELRGDPRPARRDVDGEREVDESLDQGIEFFVRRKRIAVLLVRRELGRRLLRQDRLGNLLLLAVDVARD